MSLMLEGQLDFVWGNELDGHGNDGMDEQGKKEVEEQKTSLLAGLKTQFQALADPIKKLKDAIEKAKADIEDKAEESRKRRRLADGKGVATGGAPNAKNEQETQGASSTSPVASATEPSAQSAWAKGEAARRVTEACKTDQPPAQVGEGKLSG